MAQVKTDYVQVKIDWSSTCTHFVLGDSVSLCCWEKRSTVLLVCVHRQPLFKDFHVVTSCSTNRGRDQEWRSWNTNQAIHNLIEHCSLGLLSLLLKSVPTKFINHGSNTASPVIVSLYKAGCMSLDHLKLLDVGICIGVPDT